jgi:hypothetical protein
VRSLAVGVAALLLGGIGLVFGLVSPNYRSALRSGKEPLVEGGVPGQMAGTLGAFFILYGPQAVLIGVVACIVGAVLLAAA